MDYGSLGQFLRRGRDALIRGPVALLFADEAAALAATLHHHRQIGFRQTLLFAPPRLDPGPGEGVIRIAQDAAPGRGRAAMLATVNAVNRAAPAGTWLYYGFVGEFLHYPFCESRSLPEMLAFHAEERRDAMLCQVVDLYPPHPDDPTAWEGWQGALMDPAGYHARARSDGQGGVRERQLDLYGGLRWRFEDHIPEGSRRIDRVGLFRARVGLQLQEDFTFNEAEYNTYACPWHHNLSAAVCSFRAARSLWRNPASRRRITGFAWPGSVAFEGGSRQLMELGLMEPGQWF